MQQTMNQRMVSALHKNQLVSALCFESSLINLKKLFIDGCEGESANYF